MSHASELDTQPLTASALGDDGNSFNPLLRNADGSGRLPIPYARARRIVEGFKRRLQTRESKACICLLAIAATAAALGILTVSSSRGTEVAAATAGNSPSALPIEQWSRSNVAFVSAHPDDIEALAGATIAALRAQGTNVHFIILTNGNKGCGAAFCQNFSTDEIASCRHKEALAAAASLGVSAAHVRMLGLEDGELEAAPYKSLLGPVIEALRDVRADVVISFYPYAAFNLVPSNGWDDLGYHPDHQTCGRIALDAAFFQSNKYMMPNGSAPYNRHSFYFWNLWQPTHVFEFDDDAMQRKLQTYLFHASQVPSLAWISEFLTFIGLNTPHSTSHKFAEGYQFYN